MKIRVQGSEVTFPYSLGQLKKDLPNVSIPKDADLTKFGVYDVVYEERPVVDETIYNVSVSLPPVEKDAQWVVEWNVTEKTDEEKQAVIDRESKAVRLKRNTLLSNCDYTQLADSSLSEPERLSFVTYRQALRDITDQDGFPFDIEWPVEPTL